MRMLRFSTAVLEIFLCVCKHDCARGALLTPSFVCAELPDSSVSSSRAAEQLRGASLSPHTLLPQARELGGVDTHTDGRSGLGHTHSLVQSEQEDIELSEAMSARQMSIKDR